MKKIILALIIMIALSACSARQNGTDSANEGKAEEIWEYREDIPKVPEDKRLVVYTSHKAEVYEPIIREFEERTGIWVEVVQGGTKAMLERIKNEYEFGGIDIMFGGGVETLNSYKDYFETYKAVDDRWLINELQSEDNSWTPFTELPIVFIYNTKILSEDEAPASWNELFDEKWKGRISFADPFDSGTSYTILSALIQMKALDFSKTDENSMTDEGEETGSGNGTAEAGELEKQVISAFLKQLGGNLAGGSGQVIEEVANGTRAVGITLEETALRWIADGEHIGMVYPADGTVAVPDGCAIVKNAPNHENAKIFIDYIISRDVQQYMVENVYRRTVRRDIDNPAYFPEITLADFDIVRSGEDEERILSLWREYELDQ
ncbi:MAG: ABC transporter substrate-binding protein [Lachnospiraceae bacterium]|nr:ABC transporter substrate-binding protein [Lachnospiraceae bacterium]